MDIKSLTHISFETLAEVFGAALLGEMLCRNCAPGVKCINTEVGRDEALVGFLQTHGVAHVGK